VDAIRAAEKPHVFMGVTKAGHSAILHTTGNDDTHIILRGGRRPNYDAESVNEAAGEMAAAGLTPKLMVDCSHANSRKQHDKQIDVGRDVAGQVARGDHRIMGLMIESHLVAGRQDLKPGHQLSYGQSITDACIAWDDSLPLLEELAEAVRQRRQQG
jgi:3-deoxy-7-phosphoheptulonate synthase